VAERVNAFARFAATVRDIDLTLARPCPEIVFGDVVVSFGGAGRPDVPAPPSVREMGGSDIPALLETLRCDGIVMVDDPDPGWPGARYVLRSNLTANPNVTLYWAHARGAPEQPICILGSGFSPTGDGLARAILAALFAGRKLREMTSGRVCSSAVPDHRSQRIEVTHGKRSAVEDARPGRAEEPQAEAGEAGRRAAEMVGLYFRY
jgi:hypothetical protein